MQHRRNFLRTLGGAAAGAALSCRSTAPDGPPPAKPNIVFLMADDLGYGHLGCYGQKHIRTPHIDRLAAEGMRFTDAYAGCTVCAPARATLMTGFHTGNSPVRANTGGVPLRPGDVTVADVLKDAGYATGLFGKWGLGVEGSTGEPTRQGFDEYFGYLHQIHAHFYYPEYLIDNGERYPLPGNADGARGQYSHDEIVDKALDFLRRKSGEPFFLYVPFTIPHAETLVPEDSLAEYDGKFPENPFDGGERQHYSAQEKPNAAFAGMVTRMDRDVGRIMDTLAELGLDENTIVFFTSDNGSIEGFNIDDGIFKGSGPLRGYKRDMYEGGLRVPMIVRWPGKIAAGAVSDLPWAFWDFLPTAAELAGAVAPGGIDGISVVPTLLGQAAQPRHEYLYWENPVGGDLLQAIRMEEWKAVKLGRDVPIELYNLRDDIGETTDLAGHEPEIVERMRELFVTARTEPPPQPEAGWDG
jgi:arylsulfatase A